MHSYIAQEKRTRNLVKFKEGSVNILLTTDLGSRGLDIRTVGLVVNYDFPTEYVDYVHRAGRTARGVKKGKVVSLVTQHEVDLLKAVEERVDVRVEVCKQYEEAEVLKEMNKLDKVKRKLKIKMLVNGKEEKFQKIKKSKVEFTREVRGEHKNEKKE